MRTPWKILVTLAVVLPLGGFVAGSLAASAADEPAPRETIVLDDSGPTPGRTLSPSPSSSPSRGVEVVTPSPEDLGDDHGGDRGGSDDSGHGGSGSSGSGSSGHGSDDSGPGGGGGDD